MPDRLSDDQSTVGSLVLNHGDPTYREASALLPGISPSEEVFLRFISYVPFADRVIVPGRHLLDGQLAFDAAVMAKPLLKAGLLVPERREGPGSFADVALARGLGRRQLGRGAFLDDAAAAVREFRWDDLSSTYREILLDDLGPQGSFRRVVPGALQGARRAALDAALEVYRDSGATTPEGFVAAVESACPGAANLARRWAMARYYVTPGHFDDVHIRQIPNEAAELLVRGQAIDRNLRPAGDLPPADHLAREISLNLKADEVQVKAGAYCEAAMRVRDDIPQARALFTKILDQTETREIGAEVTAAMARELEKQLRERVIDKRPYSLAIDLVMGLAGGVAGLPLGDIPGLAGGAAAGAAGSHWTKHQIGSWYDHARRPWKLAIDRLDSEMKRLGSRSK